MRLRRIIAGVLIVGVCAGAAGLAAGYALDRANERKALAATLSRGNPDKGPDAMRRFGCAGCHTISGVPGARGLVGPPLQGVRSRIYIGGVLENTAENLVQWIVNPRAIDPKSAMPVTGISEQEARDVVAFLLAR